MKLLAVFLGLAYSTDIPAKCDVPCPMNIEPVCATGKAEKSKSEQLS